jgi:hypothetical protein
LCAKERIFVYKLDSFVGFIGDEQLHAQECYVVMVSPAINFHSFVRKRKRKKVLSLCEVKYFI